MLDLPQIDSTSASPCECVFPCFSNYEILWDIRYCQNCHRKHLNLGIRSYQSWFAATPRKKCLQCTHSCLRHTRVWLTWKQATLEAHMPSSYSIIYATKHGHLIDIWPHNFVNKLTSVCAKKQWNCLQTGFFWQLWRLCWFWLLQLLGINDTWWGWYDDTLLLAFTWLSCDPCDPLWPPFSCTSLLSVSWTSAPSVLSTSSFGHDSQIVVLRWNTKESQGKLTSFSVTGVSKPPNRKCL